MNRRVLIIILLVSALFSTSQTAAQENGKMQLAVSTNLVDWASLCTLNLEAGVSVSQHLSVQAGVKYNPWNFSIGDPEIPLYAKQASARAGVRYWPWYVFSGWWVGLQAQIIRYAETGLWRHALDTGAAAGGVLSLGYTLMLNERLNLEFGAGAWAGRRFEHTLYCCPECMRVRESRPGNFVALNDLSVAVMYLF